MAELYFKTPKTSETGKKFQVLIDRSIKAHEDIKNFANDVGASDRYSTGSYYTLNTGANGFMFDNPVNTTVWKKVHTLPQGDLWYPRSTKAGKPLLERLDKMPPYIVQMETGQLAIEIYESDSPMTVLVKKFMAMFGIIDIKMRMLYVQELLKIQGFPVNYILIGNQAE